MGWLGVVWVGGFYGAFIALPVGTGLLVSCLLSSAVGVAVQFALFRALAWWAWCCASGFV